MKSFKEILIEDRGITESNSKAVKDKIERVAFAIDSFFDGYEYQLRDWIDEEVDFSDIEEDIAEKIIEGTIKLWNKHLNSLHKDIKKLKV